MLKSHTPSETAKVCYLHAAKAIHLARQVQPLVPHNLHLIVQPREPDDDEVGAYWHSPNALAQGSDLHIIALLEPAPTADAHADMVSVTNFTDWVEMVKRDRPQEAVYVDDPICGIPRVALGVRRLEHLIAHELAHAITFARWGEDAASSHGHEWLNEFRELCRRMHLTRDEIEQEAFKALVVASGLTDLFDGTRH